LIFKEYIYSRYSSSSSSHYKHRANKIYIIGFVQKKKKYKSYTGVKEVSKYQINKKKKNNQFKYLKLIYMKNQYTFFSHSE